MKQTRISMGMPVTIDIADPTASEADLAAVFDYFTAIDNRFSTYKPASEISRINRGELPETEWSDDMHIVLMLAADTKAHTNGFFDIRQPNGTLDPSGLVKGWAIWNAAKLVAARGFANFYVDAGGDVQTSGRNAAGGPWRIGIKNPLASQPQPLGHEAIVKTVAVSGGEGVATSGTYLRGAHIYNPKTGKPVDDIVSLTVIGPNIYEADRFATAAFAMGKAGIAFIESLPKTARLEGYMIDTDGIATMTTGFERYLS